MKKETTTQNKIVILGSIICSIVLLGILSTYAYFLININQNGKPKINVETGNIELTFKDGNGEINESLEFGKSITKTFTITNNGSLDTMAKINWTDLTNTYLDGSLTYTLSCSNNADGPYTIIIENEHIPRSEQSSTKELANGLEIPSKTTYYYKLTITLNYTDFDQTADLKAIFSTTFNIEVNKTYSSEDILNHWNLTINEKSPNFLSIATTDEGIFPMEDDYGTSYYFRGAVTNNYVKFADFYWRIIRINGDGSLRIQYDGTTPHANGDKSIDRVAITNVKYNNYATDAKFVGYMFGGSLTEASLSKEQAQSNETNSNIKNELEKWYKTNIADKGYDKYVNDSLFCNDRSTSDTPKTWWNFESTEPGFGKNYTAFGGFKRFRTLANKWNNSISSPQFKCPNKNDAFTKKDTHKGNGKLAEKVGIITADEAITAGGKGGRKNIKYYLYKGITYWTITPLYFWDNSNAYNFFITNDGECYHYDYTNNYNAPYDNSPVTDSYNIAPVINILPEYLLNFIGDGTLTNPYRLPNT